MKMVIVTIMMNDYDLDLRMMTILEDIDEPSAGDVPHAGSL